MYIYLFNFIDTGSHQGLHSLGLPVSSLESIVLGQLL